MELVSVAHSGFVPVCVTTHDWRRGAAVCRRFAAESATGLREGGVAESS